MRTRVGKVARLPLAIREELNRRLLENEPARKICAWLNALPEAIRVCDEFGEQPIDDRNISDWRKGGFADWLRRREQIEETREMAQWAVKLAKASGGNLSEGAAAILSGKILEILEGLTRLRDQKDEKDESSLTAVAAMVEQVTLSLSRLRKGDANAAMVEINRKRIEQKDEEIALARATFQRQTCELFLKWYEDKRAVEAAAGAGDNSSKIERLGQLMFGEDWAPAEKSTANGR